MICVYAPNESDFSTLGLGVLEPTDCSIEEEAGGIYELSLTHPIDAAGKWMLLNVDGIIRAPAPVRESPQTELDNGQPITTPTVVTRQIYRVNTPQGGRLRLRASANYGKIISLYKPGTEVAVIGTSGSWSQVIVQNGGATGWMWTAYLTFVRTQTETITGDKPSQSRVIYPVQARDQLFRIVSVEKDTALQQVTVNARHIFYDLLGNLVNGTYEPSNVAANTVVTNIFSRALNPQSFNVHALATAQVSGDYTRRAIVNSLLDPDDGVVPQAKARLVRDNFDIWILPDETRDTGVEIRHQKNLLGANLLVDSANIVTRIVPVGQTKKGDPLLLSGTVYVDSPHISDYPIIRAQAIEYDVKVGQDGISTETQARNKLRQLANADFSDNGVDLPEAQLTVDFVTLDSIPEYADYASLESVHLYDTVRVIAPFAKIDAMLRVTAYTWDCLLGRYRSVTLGEIDSLENTIYSYELSSGVVTTSKIAGGAVGSAQIRDLAVTLAKIETATIDELYAGSITALKAYLAEIIAEQVTTDELYAAIATISVAQITTANINNANIDWASISTLSADIAEISKAHLVDADIDWANITNLATAVANIADAQIANATIDTAQIANLNALIAQVAHLEVSTGSFNFADIENLVSSAMILEQGVGGSVYIKNLAATNASFIGATMDTLVLKSTDGKYYRLSVRADGTIDTEETTVTAAEIAAGETTDGRGIVETTANIADLNAQTIKASEAIISSILVSSLTADKINAQQAFISSAEIPDFSTTALKAIGDVLDISANQSIRFLTGQVDSAHETADDANEVAQTVSRWMTFDAETGLTQSMPGSIYSTLVDDVGFHILQNGEKIASFYKRKITTEEYRVGPLTASPAMVIRRAGDGGLIIVPEDNA